MRVVYGKVGRVVEVEPDKWGESGGDNEPPALLLKLATRHPDVEWIAASRNGGWQPPLPNIVNPWLEWNDTFKRALKSLYRLEDQSTETLNRTVSFYDEMTIKTMTEGVTGYVLWMGQHGTSNVPIPMKKNPRIYTKPQITGIHYAGYLLRGLNCWRYPDPLAREEVWLHADPRNHIKCRDLMWPRRNPLLAQFNYERHENVERYGDPRDPEACGFDPDDVRWSWPGVWRVRDRYVASGLEIVGIPDRYAETEPAPWEERDYDFGMLINEARAYGLRPETTRLHAMQHYVNHLSPDWVHGSWSKKALAELGYDINTIPYHEIFPLMQRTKATFTTPSSGSQWATAKPWESFATGVVCFFHPLYDTQDHILFPDGRDAARADVSHLHAWLRVKDPDELERKVKAVTTSRETWEWIVSTQYHHFRRELTRQRCLTTIEERLGLCNTDRQSSLLAG